MKKNWRYARCYFKHPSSHSLPPMPSPLPPSHQNRREKKEINVFCSWRLSRKYDTWYDVYYTCSSWIVAPIVEHQVSSDIV